MRLSASSFLPHHVPSSLLIRLCCAAPQALTQGGSTPGPREDLSAALEAQEELVRRVAQEKEGMRRRLAGLERLILRGDGLVKVRGYRVWGTGVGVERVVLRGDGLVNVCCIWMGTEEGGGCRAETQGARPGAPFLKGYGLYGGQGSWVEALDTRSRAMQSHNAKPPAESGTLPISQERRSFDGSVDLATLGYRGGSETPEGRKSSGGAGLGAEAAGRVSARRSGLWPSGPGPAEMVRASWNPGSTTVIGQGGVAGLPARRGQVWGRQGRGAVAGGEGSGSTSHRSPGQLLELRLTPSVRKVS